MIIHWEYFIHLNHEILLRKLDHNGITGIMTEWFKNYLLERKQIVKYKSKKSESLRITWSAPSLCPWPTLVSHLHE